MAYRHLTTDELTELLGRFPMERAGARTFEEIAEAELQLLIARLEALTALLLGAEPNETARLASMMLLRSLAAIAARFRGRANVIRPSLATARTELRESLAACDARLVDAWSSK